MTNIYKTFATILEKHSASEPLSSTLFLPRRLRKLGVEFDPMDYSTYCLLEKEDVQ